MWEWSQKWSGLFIFSTKMIFLWFIDEACSELQRFSIKSGSSEKEKLSHTITSTGTTLTPWGKLHKNKAPHLQNPTKISKCGTVQEFKDTFQSIMHMHKGNEKLIYKLGWRSSTVEDTKANSLEQIIFRRS